MTEEMNWPEGVTERLTWWAENNSKTLQEAHAEFSVYLRDTLGIDDPASEEGDFLIESAETFVVERRRATGAGETVEFVGCFIGVDKKVTDKRAADRQVAVNAVRENLSGAIANGIVARGYTENGRWMLETKDGVTQTEDSAEGDDPWWLFREGDLNLALLQTNSEWKTFGRPIRPQMWSRTYYFLGNVAEEYNNEILLWAIRVGDPEEKPSFAVQIGAPVRCKVRPPRQGNTDIPFVTAANKFQTTIRYTDDFVEESDRALLAPERLWPAHDMFCELPELEELYHAGSRKVAGIDNPIGPLVIVKGKVTDVNREGWEDSYGDDPTSRRYPMRISSFDLQRAHPDGLRREVQCICHGHLVQVNHAFDYKDGDRWLPYANKSTVLVFGRLGLRAVKDDDGNVTDHIPRINALGFYTVPRLVIPGGEGGDTDISQFGGGA